MRGPPSGHGAPRWATSTAATEVVCKGQPKGNTTKSLTGLCLSYHSLFPSHRITPRDRQTRSGSALLGNAIVRILQSVESGAASNEAALPLKHCFIKGGNILNHTSAELNLADYVSITFERQKNDRKSDTVTQWKTSDPVMCPVKLWASIVKRILTYKGTNTDSPVSLALHRNSTISITSEMVANLLKDGVIAIGETKLGINYSEVSTHLIQSGATITMYLAGVPIFSIMLIG
jgi:hypothetical protein